MIGGFILGGGSNNARIAVRGVGPSLAQFGLNPVLADPVLELRDANGVLLSSNDNWMDDPISAALLTANGLGLGDNERVGHLYCAATGTIHRDPGRKERRHRHWVDRGLQSPIANSGRALLSLSS